MSFRRPSHSLLAVVALVVLACTPPASVGGVRATPGGPSAEWKAPAEAGAPLRDTETKLATRGSAVPPDVVSRMDRLALIDIVDLALGNSPQTRATWAQARAAASTYGSARGHYFPSLELDGAGGPTKVISASTFIPATRTAETATLALSYVLFDFGARGGNMAAAHEALFAADLTHNSTVQSVVLQAQGAYFTYQASV